MVRLLALLDDLTDIELRARNLDRIPDSKMTSAILYDGDEVAEDKPTATGGRPNVIHASPQIVINLGEVPENAGTVANQKLAEVKRLVLMDTTLANLCGQSPTCGAYYGGAETSLKSGRTTQVELIVNFIIGYDLKPYDL